jgi:serine/threonine-protein kinase HipA
MKDTNREILVYSDIENTLNSQRMGVLLANQIRGKEVFSFEYDKSWLNNSTISFDPDLKLYTGKQFLNNAKNNFGIFMDSSPDRWGRVLMRKKEAINARLEGRKERNLFETDYLLGVYDMHRMGAIRYKTSENSTFANSDAAMAAPPFTYLRELEQASLNLEKDNPIDDSDYLKWLNMLMAPGSSLGGARPKASVIDSEKELWKAKFPSNFDDKDTAAWELLCNILGKQAGINVAMAKIQKFSHRYHTFLTKRFDRDYEKRVHFASAMTLLGYADGNDFQDGVSYLEIAEFIIRNGTHVNEDLEQIWRRIVFNICISNTDDHLRNHGFLFNKHGWRLSPAYDLNPIETGTGLKLNISESDNSLNTELARDVAVYFRVKESKVSEIIKHTKKVVSTWRSVADKLNISRNEQVLMSRAFQNE